MNNLKCLITLIFGILVFITNDMLLMSEETKSEKDFVDFSGIKDLIKKDGLEDEFKKKEAANRILLDQKKREEMKRYNIPSNDEFWTPFSELWLIKNAQTLKWDFHKPNFEIEKAFVSWLEEKGYFEYRVKILLLDTTEIIHAALPSNRNEVLLLLSLPFIRTLDLSKIEISLLLFEDFLRLQKEYLKNYIESKELLAFLGTNFNGKALDKKLIQDHLKKYNEKLFEKGFSFQEQFEVTMEMDRFLKSDLKMWNTYLTLLEKIDQLAKTNLLYKKYGQIYPSPELQINWLRPKPSRL